MKDYVKLSSRALMRCSIAAATLESSLVSSIWLSFRISI